MTSNDGNEADDLTSLREMVTDVVDEGIPVVAPAGNSGPGYYTIESPGIAEEAITVGAVSIDERIWGYSSRGPTPYEKLVKPEVVCVGVNVECPVPDEGGDISLETKTGTSVANSIVSGVVTNIKSAHPDWTAQRLKNALIATAKPLTHDDHYYDVFTQGAGLVDAEKAINADIIPTNAVINIGGVYTTKTKSSNISIENISDTQYEIEIRPLLSRVGGSTCSGRISVSPSKLTIPPNQTEEIEVRLEPPEKIGLYSGRLFLQTPDGDRIGTLILGYAKFDESTLNSKPEINQVKPDIQR